MAITRKKRAVETKKLEIGQKVLARLLGMGSRQWKNPDTGVDQTAPTYIFLELSEKAGNLVVPAEPIRFALYQDAGLRSAFESALVVDGDVLEIERLEKTTTRSGFQVNQYDVAHIEGHGLAALTAAQTDGMASVRDAHPAA